MAPARLFPSVNFSNLSLSFLLLFPSSCRGPVEPVLMRVSIGGGGSCPLWAGGGETVGLVTFFFLFLFLRNQSQFKIMSLLIHLCSVFIGTYPPPPCQSG